MTGETKQDTEAWVADKNAKYAYAYDKGDKLKRELGVGGIPAAFLVDPQGTIVWQGHPGELTDKIVEGALDGALPKPLFDLPASAAGVRTALGKRNYAGALAEAAKLPEAEGADLKKAIESMVATRVKTMKTALEKGDFLTAQDLSATLKKELAGLPQTAEAETVAATVKADKAAARVIGLQKKIRAIEAQSPRKKKDIEKALAELGKLKKDADGTFAASEVDALQLELSRRRNQLD